jgi:hypothetical protein
LIGHTGLTVLSAGRVHKSSCTLFNSVDTLKQSLRRLKEPARMWSRDQRTSYLQMPLRNWRLWAVGMLKVFEKNMSLALKYSNPISRHHDAVNCGARHRPGTGEYFDDTRRYLDRLDLNDDNRSERGLMIPNSGRRSTLSITQRFRAPIGRLARVYRTMRYRVILHAQ